MASALALRFYRGGEERAQEDYFTVTANSRPDSKDTGADFFTHTCWALSAVDLDTPQPLLS